MSAIKGISEFSKKVFYLFSQLSLEEANQARRALDRHRDGVQFQGRNYKSLMKIESHPILSAFVGLFENIYRTHGELTQDLMGKQNAMTIAHVCQFARNTIDGSGRALSTSKNGSIRIFEMDALKKNELEHSQSNERKGNLNRMIDHISSIFSTLLRSAAGQ